MIIILSRLFLNYMLANVAYINYISFKNNNQYQNYVHFKVYTINTLFILLWTFLNTYYLLYDIRLHYFV